MFLGDVECNFDNPSEENFRKIPQIFAQGQVKYSFEKPAGQFFAQSPKKILI